MTRVPLDSVLEMTLISWHLSRDLKKIRGPAR